MTSPPPGVERRVGQRFSFNLPVSFRDLSSAAEGLGFTQDVSSRGTFFFTDTPLREGAEIELTLRMPGEITLGETMLVRCRGRILRITQAADPANKDWSAPAADVSATETKIGVAVCLSGYEYLSEEDGSSADFRRISALHTHAEVPVPPASATTPRPSDR
jgi:hypothetical protein